MWFTIIFNRFWSIFITGSTYPINTVNTIQIQETLSREDPELPIQWKVAKVVAANQICPV
ncbi:hypothetical protein AN958_10310 [Leucoagaricus sp. SymC.cos]|nr:hypothetical protein AN958_10310 [Leucoagaricus sp. SymC.cos]